MKQVRLPAYDASELDRLSYSNGTLVNDITNMTVRYMDGETPGGFKLATQTYVQTNAITSENLESNLATALEPYALTTDLVPYALTADVNSAISAIPIYSLPIAGNSSGALGGVKVDGTSITINPTTGVISGSNQYTLPIATTDVIGGVRPDGTTITINPSTGVISGANTYTLPAATTTVRGGVIVPAVATSGINNSSGTISLAQATTTQLGGVKVDGTSITINTLTGVISGANTYTLPAATTTTLGGVIVPATANSGLTNTSGTIRLATATTNQLGGVKVDGVTITINGSGVIAANITGAIVFQGGWSAATNTPTLSNASSAYNTNGFEFVTTAAGTVNFGAGNVNFAVGDNVIYDGVKWVKIPIGSSAGTTNNALTFDDSGTGDVSGASFNGTSAVTISSNTIGASPLAGSSSIVTVGTIAAGTWNGSVIDPTYGGTGVNNGAFTLTISGASRTLDQSVATGASPSFDGANFTGTASGMAAGSATTAGSAVTAGTATNVAGGSANQIHYQTSADTTNFITAASGTDTFLSWTGSAFAWNTVAAANTATNIAGGAVRQLLVQTGAGATGFVTAPVTTNTYLRWDGTNFVFSAVTGATGGTVTSVSGTGTVNGLTLTGTVTSTGSLTLGGTLSLVSPPAIGSTTANTGRFTTVTSTVTTGTAPFIVASTTNVANLNASSLGGATFASPGAIGSSVASTGVFTTLTYTDARDVVFAGGGTTGTITPNAANGNVQTITLSGNITLNAFASPISGQSITLIIRQPASGGPRLLSSTMLFAGGIKTLSTAANAIDMITISYIGTTYYASLVTGFA